MKHENGCSMTATTYPMDIRWMCDDDDDGITRAPLSWQWLLCRAPLLPMLRRSTFSDVHATPPVYRSF
jgi:hypothetical protein